MKKTVLTLAILITSSGCFSQKTSRISHYTLPAALEEEKMLVLKMPFGKADILQISGDTTGIERAGDIFIEVVCTDYPSDISLDELNKKRLAAFLARFPAIKNGQLAQVHFLRQLDGKEKEKAAGMFHGLVARYRMKQSVETMKHDIDQLDRSIISMEVDSVEKTGTVEEFITKDNVISQLKLKKGIPDKNSPPPKYASQPYDMSVTGYVGYRHYPDDSSINISPKEAYRKKLISKAAYRAYDWTPMVTLFFRRIDSNASKPEKPAPVEAVTVTNRRDVMPVYATPDSTLLKIFARMKWKNFTVVEDVTVSMYPYSAQLLLWIKKQSIDSVTNRYVFFNDGNEMPDAEKKIGSTGGIYANDCRSFAEVKKLIRETMEKGSGGDRSENDVEALLQGEKKFPESDFQVLIADNRAPIKDKILISKLTKPVYIILCGANANDINIEYVTLAWSTKGSVHLAEYDSFQPDKTIFQIGQHIYKIENNILVEKGFSVQ